MTPGFAATLSRGQARRSLERLFADHGLAEPAADAAVLLEEATGLTRAALLTGAALPLGPAAAERLTGFAARRLTREPVFRIVGQRAFWTTVLRITPAVLDPRPDTETVVHTALAALSSRREEPLRVLDLGTGSGAILCALLAEWPAATGVGIDLSPEACRIARHNADAAGVGARALIACGAWADAVTGPFDVVASNPPYIETGALAGLDPEVRDHDPHLALDGGPDGLAAYRALAPALSGLLAPGGLAVLEIGWTQADAVVLLLAAQGLDALATHRDAAGRDRVVSARRAASAT